MTEGSSGPAPALLCDADGCLFPSEEPAYEASAQVTAAFLADMGVDRTYSAEELQAEFVGLNFRATAVALCRRHGVSLSQDVLEHWTGLERDVVTRHLARELRPDPSVGAALARIAPKARLAVVSSSARPRIDACLEATDLTRLFAADQRFSAESLEPPASKPDPAVYLRAARCLGEDSDLLAVEDSVVGVRAAVAAGIPVLGLVQFVAPDRRRDHTAALLDAGAARVLASWDAVVEVAADRWARPASATAPTARAVLS